ncbi:MAG: AsmA family protein [Burkholderiales bacterium]|nr:AsmA family protein [Burkholderiales bacterium]
MKRGKKIGLGIAIGLIALLLIAPLLATLINWNFAKPWIAKRVADATGRSFAINGDLLFTWKKPTTPLDDWRRPFPWPHLRAHKLVLGNPDWASTGPTMASMPQVDFTLNPFSLFSKTVSVSKLVLTEPDLNLEMGKEGQNNWDFKKSETPSEWQLDLRNLIITRGTVRLVDPVKKADITTRIDTLDDGSLTWKIKGKLNDDPVSGSGKAGALLALRGHDVKYPVEAELKAGETVVTAKGTLTDPQHLSALDIHLKIIGASMAQLFPLSGLVLPETPKFSTEGRVVGTIAPDNVHLRYENFKGIVGSSDIGGTLEYLRRQPRPLLRGKVTSNALYLQDLGTLVGGDADQERRKRTDAPKQPPDKVLPVAPFRTERWDKIDAQVEFTGNKIVRSESLPIDNLHTNIGLQNGVLILSPLNFGVAGGRFTTDLTIDGKAKAAKAKMKITARGLKLNQLFPAVQQMKASIGQVHGDAQLSATGNSLAALAGSANGELKAFISQGTVSKFILEAMGLNIGSIVVTKLFGDRQVQLNCMASDFGVKDGLMHVRTFVVDTDAAFINITGDVSLAKEEMGLTIYPESKGVRMLSLRSPLYVRGTFKHPDAGIDKGVVAAKAGAAIALGTVASPLAALLALINPGPNEESPCASLLAEARKKPAAPPPGKTVSAE